MRRYAYVLFFLSGCASLIYELVWTRQLTLVLGSTTYAITTVVVSFMAGLALGSYVAGRRSSRLVRPGRMYAALELGIGLYALLVPFFLAAAEPAYRALYPHVVQFPVLLTACRFLLSLLVLAFPTICMGATLPVLMTYITRSDRGIGHAAGWLYGINTCGATVGSALAGFWLMPSVGLFRTNLAAAGMNFTIAAVAWWLLRNAPAAEPVRKTNPTRQPRKPAATQAEPLSRAMDAVWPVLVVSALSGLVSMMYQVGWTRALIMSLGSSTYSFTCILTAFILGLGLGSLAVARFADRFDRPLVVLGIVELFIGLSALTIIPIHGRIPFLVQRLVVAHQAQFQTLLTLEFLLVVAVTLVPTLLMGAAFPLMTRVVGQHTTHSGEAIGRVYVINTVGAIVGCMLAGFLLIRGDVLGVRNTIWLAALVNTAVGTWLIVRTRPAGRKLRPALIGSVCLIAIFTAVSLGTRWDIAALTSGPFRQPGAYADNARRIIFYEEGVDTTVAVEQVPQDADQLTLTVNGKPDASTHPRDIRTQSLLGHLPAVLAPDKSRACVIGLGCGMTVDAVALHETFVGVDCVEISSAVIRAADLFAPFVNNVLTNDPRVRLIRQDGRNHLLLGQDQYGLIISEPSNPWISGVSSLFTREFFEISRRRLTSDGRLAIWMHSYSMSHDDFRMVVRTLSDVFPFVSLWQLENTDFCLVAGNAPFQIPVAAAMTRCANPAVRADLYRAGMRDLGALLGTFVSSGKTLRDWAAPASLHTDDNARLEFSAPRNLYRREALALATQLDGLQTSPLDGVIDAGNGDARSEQLRTRVTDAIDARRALTRAFAQWRDGKQREAITSLVQSYERDIGNPAVYETLQRLIAIYESRPARDAGLDEHIRRARQVPAPIVIPPRGTDAATLARSMFRQSQQSNFLPGVLVYLADAHELSPDDGLIAGSLVLATMKAGRAQDAQRIASAYLAHHPADGWGNYAAAVLASQRGDVNNAKMAIERALRSGVLNAEQLASDPLLQPILPAIDLQQLAREATQTRAE